MSGTKSDLTVLVFKDNSSARTFRVPIQWISRFGLIIGVTSAIACLGVFLSLKYYLAARRAIRTADPAYVQDLETEIASLHAANAQSATRSQLPISTDNKSSQTSTTAVEANPVPTVTVTVTPPAGETSATASTLAFSALPGSILALPPGEVPINIYDPHVNWAGRTLKVQFFIQYAREDRGNQQGRIILLARGADTVLAYPAGVLNTEQSQALLAPEKGEYFSVSRIREVRADFGPMKSRTALKNVEVFLFSTDGKLLLHQILVPQEDASAPPAEKDTGNQDNEKEDP